MSDTELNIAEYYGDKEMRWYQIASRNATIKHIRDGVRRILICQPTGCGKTLTIAATLDHDDIRSALNITENRPLRVFMIAHVHRLLTQAEQTFAVSNNVDIRTGTPFSTVSQEDIDWTDIFVIDEAHHEAMMSIQYQLDRLATKPIIGLTATPDRADGMLIKFEEIINPITREQAVSEGHLAETSIWSFLDTSGKNKTNIIKDVAKEYSHLMGSTMCFMATKVECIEVAKYINSLGITCVALTTQTPAQLDDILNKFSAGEIQWIVNCQRIGEGVDVQGCTSVVFGRNINSYPLLNQFIGRAARPDSECYVFELVNPLSGSNLDTTVVVGTPKNHVLCSSDRKGGFVEREFDYVSHNTGMVSGLTM